MFEAFIALFTIYIFVCGIHNLSITIQDYSFWSCTSLKTLEISNSIKELGAFSLSEHKYDIKKVKC